MAQRSLLNFFTKKGSGTELKREDDSAFTGNASPCVPYHRGSSQKRPVSLNEITEDCSPLGKGNSTRQVGIVKLSPHTPHTAGGEQPRKRNKTERSARSVVDDDCDWKPVKEADDLSPIDEEWSPDVEDGSTAAELTGHSKGGDDCSTPVKPSTVQEKKSRNPTDRGIPESDPAAKTRFLEAVGEECELPGGSSTAGAWAEARAKFDWLQPQSIVDGSGKRPGEAGFDSRTVRVPKAVFDKLSASQKQYWSTKCKYMDTVLFFKVGKFYELYEVDAEVGHKELDWKLTVSGVGKCRQVGVPESGVDDAVQKLVARGYKVGRMEQTETGEEARAKRGPGAMVQRCLTQILSPATLAFGDGPLRSEATHLLALKEMEGPREARAEEDNCHVSIGFAFADVAGGSIFVGSLLDDASRSALSALLAQVHPREVLFQNDGIHADTLRLLRQLSSTGHSSPTTCMQLTPLSFSEFPPPSDARHLIASVFGDAGVKVSCHGITSSSSNGITSSNSNSVDGGHEGHPVLSHATSASLSSTPSPLQTAPKVPSQAASAAVALAALTLHLRRLKWDESLIASLRLQPHAVFAGAGLRLDGNTVANLELLANSHNGTQEGTLMGLLDRCTTAAGKRLLRRWICRPLTDIPRIERRLDALEALMALNVQAREEVRAGLRKLPDVERLIGRVQSIAGKRRLVHVGGEEGWVTSQSLLPPAMAEQQLRREVSIFCQAVLAIRQAAAVLNNLSEHLPGNMHRSSNSTPPASTLLLHCIAVAAPILGPTTGVNPNPLPAMASHQEAEGTEGWRTSAEATGAPPGGSYLSGSGSARRHPEGSEGESGRESCAGMVSGAGQPQVVRDCLAGCPSPYLALALMSSHISGQESSGGGGSGGGGVRRGGGGKGKGAVASSSPRLVHPLEGCASPSGDKTRQGRERREEEGGYEVVQSEEGVLAVLLQVFVSQVEAWKAVASAIACVDVLAAMAEASQEMAVYGPTCRPTFVAHGANGEATHGSAAGPYLRACGGSADVGGTGRSGSGQSCGGSTFHALQLWHPFAVSLSEGQTVVPNNLLLGGAMGVREGRGGSDSEGSVQPRAVLLTGPNMGGKSTMLRATCVAVVMAQMGCFVPARSLTLSPVDTVFTRIGASDRILTGDSTFMVECREAATILRNATSRSLVILDELGRGTSTFDGHAIAHAVLKDLTSRLDCRLLFATHYHSLTLSFDKHPRVALRHMACLIRDAASSKGSTNAAHLSSEDVTADISFLYSLAEGACPKSYGLRVASMAGIPRHIVEAAASAVMRIQTNHTNNHHQAKALVECPSEELFLSFRKNLLTTLYGGTGNAVDVLKGLRDAFGHVRKNSM